MKTIEQKIKECMMGRSIIPREFAEILYELNGAIEKLTNLRSAFKDRMKEESPIRIGDKVKLWGGGLTVESYEIGTFYVCGIVVFYDGSFKYLFYNCKKDGTKSRVKSEIDYSEIEKIG